MPIQLARTDDEIATCFAVMQQLRPQLVETDFVSRIRSQMASGYQLALVETNGHVVAVAGFRLLENLAWGRFLYVDDLVTDAAYRSQGHGDALLSWLMGEAKRQGCGELHLDSGVQRFGAHRFYLSHRMDITSHHFAIQLSSIQPP